MDVLLVDGDLQRFNRHTRGGSESLAQRVAVRLSMWLGEVLTQASAGIDYPAIFEAKPPDLDVISTLLRAQLLGIRGVRQVVDFRVTFNASTQTLSGSGTIVAAEEDLTLEVTVPFEIGGQVTVWPVPMALRGAPGIF